MTDSTTPRANAPTNAPAGAQPAPQAHPNAAEASVAGQRAANSSVGELLSEVSHDLSALIRQEMELAKAEMRESARRAGKGAGLLSGAAIAGYFALLFLTIAVWIGLSVLINSFAWAAVIVAVLYGIAAAVLAMMGRKKLESVQGAPRTMETTKKIPDALKPDKETR